MKRAFFNLLYILGFTNFAAWWNRKKVLFLCFHSVTGSKTKLSNDPFGLHIRAECFEKQLEYLQHNYHFISLSEYLKARSEKQRFQPYSVVLTFDDGFRNFLTVALPSLVKRGIPASLFIITDNALNDINLDNYSNWSLADDYTYLTWTEINYIKQHTNIEIGSHTCSHPLLTNISSDQIIHELKGSFDSIVNNLGEPPVALAYPKGSYSKSVAEKANSIGYLCALTTDQGATPHNNDLFTLKRIMIGDQDDIASFAVRGSGLREWLIMVIPQQLTSFRSLVTQKNRMGMIIRRFAFMCKFF